MDKIRELFVRFIYLDNLVGIDKETFLENFGEEVEGEGIKKLEKLIDFYIRNKEEVLKELSYILVGWKVERLLELDRSAILGGMCEMLMGESPDDIIPAYGTFARVFSSDKSPSFVMGVLKSFKEVIKK
ncbi:MAG: transcription antitermination factor NusB [candidate division WOR-3 bacterium]